MGETTFFTQLRDSLSALFEAVHGRSWPDRAKEDLVPERKEEGAADAGPRDDDIGFGHTPVGGVNRGRVRWYPDDSKPHNAGEAVCASCREFAPTVDPRRVLGPAQLCPPRSLTCTSGEATDSSIGLFGSGCGW